jgi:hypothetical protein
MPPPNRLARPLTNSLAYSVPVPLEPGMMRPAPAAFSPRRELENLSIGLGRGAVTGMEGTKQLLTQPVATAQALIEAARQLGTDPAVILDMLRAARQKAMSGSLGLGELIGENVTPGMRGRQVPAMRELDVYHGTPHRFPATEANQLGEFDASKIGTGEGAQAYGHGIYYAESPDIAKHYQTQLGKFYDQMQTPEGAMSLEEAVTKYHPDGKIAAKVLSTFRTKTDVNTFNKVINDEILPEIRAKYPQSEWGKFAPQQGTLYKADLPDEMIDRMLDWDKPLREQPEIYQKVLADKNWRKRLEFRTDAQVGELTGAELYGMGHDQTKRLGIPGIKYLDAGSRGKGGSGTRNFVVFPGEEKKVRILERK